MAASLKHFATTVSGAQFRVCLLAGVKIVCRTRSVWQSNTREACSLHACSKDSFLANSTLLFPPPLVRLAGQSSSGTCWNCSEALGKTEFVCRRCETPQEMSHRLNYFEVFNEEEKYNIDASKLQRKFRDLQRLLHPDRFAAKSKKEQALSDNLSALVNQAYQTLSKPEKRANYLLKLNGKDLDSVVLDSDFLARMMELNEEVASIEEQCNQRSAKESFKALQNETEELEEQLSAAFEKDNLDQASIQLAKLKYLRNIEAKLKDILEK